MLSDNNKSYLHLHLIVFIWGFTAILGRLITLDALPLVWYRMLFAVGFIFFFIKYKKLPIKIPKHILLKFLVAGLVIALHWFTFFRAIKVSNVSITLACLSTGAFFTSLIEPIFFGKKIVWYEIFFGLIVVFGLSIIFNVEGRYVEGILLALTSAFLSASFAVINSKFVKDYDPSVISYYELGGGVLFFSIFLLFTNSFNSDFFQLTTSDFVYLLILSSVCTAYAFIASTAVMKFLSPYTVMLTINFEDKEQMSPQFYVGAVIILLTVILNGILKSRLKTT
jgi:drug/metabolite transporter (DMT)-like permease